LLAATYRAACKIEGLLGGQRSIAAFLFVAQAPVRLLGVLEQQLAEREEPRRRAQRARERQALVVAHELVEPHLVARHHDAERLRCPEMRRADGHPRVDLPHPQLSSSTSAEAAAAAAAVNEWLCT